MELLILLALPILILVVLFIVVLMNMITAPKIEPEVAPICERHDWVYNEYDQLVCAKCPMKAGNE